MAEIATVKVKFTDEHQAQIIELCEQYKAENAKLRQQLADVTESMGRVEGRCAKLREELADVRQITADELEKQIGDYRARHIEQAGIITELESENAELRELVLEAWRSCPAYEDDCKRCPHYLGKSDYWCDIPIRMEALGIEVGA